MRQFGQNLTLLARSLDQRIHCNMFFIPCFMVAFEAGLRLDQNAFCTVIPLEGKSLLDQFIDEPRTVTQLSLGTS